MKLEDQIKELGTVTIEGTDYPIREVSKEQQTLIGKILNIDRILDTEENDLLIKKLTSARSEFLSELQSI